MNTKALYWAFLMRSVNYFRSKDKMYGFLIACVRRAYIRRERFYSKRAVRGSRRGDLHPQTSPPIFTRETRKAQGGGLPFQIKISKLPSDHK